MVQVRDLTSHKPLCGVTAGDIGPKIGFHSMDNGFATFDHVRIPRTDMLARFARVEKGGRFVKPPHSKLAYATMVFVRATLVFTAYGNLGRAATIATRYSAVRRQFAPNKKVRLLDVSV
jgi:acyl-CoA oxidase